jgi:hypothetical protein
MVVGAPKFKISNLLILSFNYSYLLVCQAVELVDKQVVLAVGGEYVVIASGSCEAIPDTDIINLGIAASDDHLLAMTDQDPSTRTISSSVRS